MLSVLPAVDGLSVAVLNRQRSPQLFSSRPAGAVRTLVAVGAAIVLMVFDHQSGGLQRMHATLSALVYPLQKAVDVPSEIAGWAREKLATHATLVSENEDLRQRLQQAEAQLQQLAALDQENARLRALMQANTRLPGRLSGAELMAADLDPFRHRVIVDKGAGDGVFEGQTVLDSSGIVGQVTRVEPWVSEVTLISDPGQAIQVEINRTGLRTLAVGSAELDQLSLPYLTNNADVKPGDLLVSSGLGGRYPAGYPVGAVTRFERNPAENFATAAASTSADLIHGRVVLLYWPPPPAEHASKPAATVAAPRKKP